MPRHAVRDPDKQCTGKIPYFTRRKARQARRRMKGRDHQVQPYQCPHCGFWHLGGKLGRKE